MSNLSRLAFIKVTTPGSYPYAVVAADDVVLVDTASARTITLPSPSSTKRRVTIKDSKGTAGTNNITISPNASESIEGTAGNYVVGQNWACIDFVSDGTNWYAVQGEKTAVYQN